MKLSEAIDNFFEKLDTDLILSRRHYSSMLFLANYFLKENKLATFLALRAGRVELTFVYEVMLYRYFIIGKSNQLLHRHRSSLKKEKKKEFINQIIQSVDLLQEEE